LILPGLLSQPIAGKASAHRNLLWAPAKQKIE